MIPGWGGAGESQRFLKGPKADEGVDLGPRQFFDFPPQTYRLSNRIRRFDEIMKSKPLEVSFLHRDVTGATPIIGAR